MPSTANLGSPWRSRVTMSDMFSACVPMRRWLGLQQPVGCPPLSHEWSSVCVRASVMPCTSSYTQRYAIVRLPAAWKYGLRS